MRDNRYNLQNETFMIFLGFSVCYRMTDYLFIIVCYGPLDDDYDSFSAA